jgi:signal transduction histidine kinase
MNELTDLATFTSGLVEVFRPACERVGLQLVVDCPPLNGPALADRGIWQRVVLDLLARAVKFSAGDEIEVQLRQPGRSVELCIRYTGAGHAARNELATVRELVGPYGGSVSTGTTSAPDTTTTIDPR